MNTFIKLEWWNDCDLHGTLYSEGLKNWLYVDGDAGRAAYAVDEQGVESDTGEFTPELQRWTKRVSIEFPAPEFMIDALHYATLCDNVYYYDKFGGVFRCEFPAVNFEWIEGECIAVVEFSFQIATVLKTTCQNLTIGSDV